MTDDDELVVPWLFIAFMKQIEQDVMNDLRDEELARDYSEPTEDLMTELVF